MLKPISLVVFGITAYQPPLGGCVLKPMESTFVFDAEIPAAFRRLCVETLFIDCLQSVLGPAAFRRLCVET